MINKMSLTRSLLYMQVKSFLHMAYGLLDIEIGTAEWLNKFSTLLQKSASITYLFRHFFVSVFCHKNEVNMWFTFILPLLLSVRHPINSFQLPTWHLYSGLCGARELFWNIFVFSFHPYLLFRNQSFKEFAKREMAYQFCKEEVGE